MSAIYPKLSYRIIGCMFDVYNELGFGRREKIYQNAIKKLFIKKNIKFSEQCHCPIKFQGDLIGKNYLDFLVEDKIVVEIKTGSYFRKKDFDQVIEYLKLTGKKLGLLICFAKDRVRQYRVLNVE